MSLILVFNSLIKNASNFHNQECVYYLLTSFFYYLCYRKQSISKLVSNGLNIESYLPDRTKNNIILFYKGNVDSDVINQILDEVEYKMIQENDRSKLRKKVYNVLVESLQNLYHHVDKVPEDYEDQTSEKFGILLVKKVDKGYKIITVTL